MDLIHFFSHQLDRELPISRRVLGRVPEDQAGGKPHDTSMELGSLATLVANMPMWIALIVGRDELDIEPKEGKGVRPEPWKTRQELLAQFDQAAEQGRAALMGTSENFLATKWKLLAGGKVMDERPRHEVIADTLCHAAHHRGQLSVYLRMLEIPITSIYGPSADDKSS